MWTFYHFPRESASSLASLIRYVGRHGLGAWLFIPSPLLVQNKLRDIPLCLCFKASLSAKMTLICMKMKMHAELIFI